MRVRVTRPAVDAARIVRLAMAGIGVALMAGCATSTPGYKRPAPPVPAVFPQASATSGIAAAEMPWIDFLGDARLRLLVERALQNNRDLRIAVLNAEQARAQLGVQRADRLPTLNGVVSASRAPGSNGSIASTYAAGLAVSAFELDLFGRVSSLTEAAAARYLASEEGRRAAQVTLVGGVAAADLALRADDELLALTASTLATREQSLKLARVRFDAGAAAEGELRGAESLVAAARAALIALQRQRALDLDALVLLVGEPVPDSLPAVPALRETRFADPPAGLPAEVLLQRPDVRQAEQLLQAAHANVGAARAAFFPRITLTGSAGFASTALKKLFDNVAWTFAPQLVQPLFDGGRNESSLAAADAARAIAVAQYEKAIQTAFREVADALAGRATLADQLAAQQAQADAEARRLELATLLFKGGAASQLDVLDAERSSLAARQAVVQLELAKAQNAVLLYRVLGGGAGLVVAR